MNAQTNAMLFAGQVAIYHNDRVTFVPASRFTEGDKMAIGDIVRLPKGTGYGMTTLRYNTNARVTHVMFRDDGSEFYRVEWIDIKGRVKSTYI